MPKNESEIHMEGDPIETTIKRLPRDLVERCSNAIRCVFEYIVQVISGDIEYKI